MESIVLIAILVTIVSAYLLRQFWVHALEVDDAPTGDLAPPDARDAGDLKAA
ncbi:MAG TPA: hypothetical protein VFH62_03195 [Dehalococcoidia bacterium]|jgi:hypothetical protein|nr:hypothetical protein [Dehalococcoidia bacterium]